MEDGEKNKVRTRFIKPWYYRQIALLIVAAVGFVCVQINAQDERWSESQANAWYGKQAWPVGADFLPSTSINELEMWQAESFDPATIDRELGWAE